jgi:transposase
VEQYKKLSSEINTIKQQWRHFKRTLTKIATASCGTKLRKNEEEIEHTMME